MSRTFAALSFSFFAALATFAAPPSTAAAQESYSPSLSVDDEEMGVINTEADWATALYVSSVISAVGGVALVVGGVVSANSCTYGGYYSSCNTGGAVAMYGIGAALLVLFPGELAAAIGLDIASGVRRRRLENATAFRLTPGPGEAGVGFNLTF